MKKKFIPVLMAVGSVLYSTYCIHDFIHMARQKFTRELERDLAAVPDGLEKTPVGVPRAEQFLQRLKTVDASHAPAEVQQALRDYIATLEGALDAIKTGRDTSPYNSSMSQSKERLRQCLSKYE
jgi:hypothetical protein